MKAKEELKELKLKSVSELQRLLAASREKMRDLKFKVSQNQLKNIREIRQIRKKISRILTILKEKQASISNAKKTENKISN
ncbi:MAG TPA: 50S ribosomal protein L29 [Candidatus Uhrbacteria bacterium]|nr:50S ribosomal protein L29 [Candidatus Uhrbacteria bacterium]